MLDMDKKVIEDIQAVVADYQKSLRNDASLQFWKSLGDKHATLIRESGFGNFKRTVNFEYSQWGVTSFRDPKIASLIKNLLREGRLPSGGFKARFDGDDLDHIRWPDVIDSKTGESLRATGSRGRSKIRAYAFYCGLLWQYASAHDALRCLELVKEPALGNPLPIRYGGQLISQDLALSSLELNHIASKVPLRQVRRVLEIGAGYGRYAFPHISLFPDTEYWILDIPPALAISQNYLASIFGPEAISPYTERGVQDSPRRRINFMLPDDLKRSPDNYFDLVLNISSFDEMSTADVDDYLTTIDRVGSGWLYLQGHARSRKPGFRYGVEEFPYRKAWKEVFSATHPVVPWFVEKILKLA